MKKLFAIFIVLLLPLSALAASHGSGMGWFGTQVASSLIHGVVYGLIFKVFHALGLVPSLVVGALVLGGVYLWHSNRKPT